MRRRAAGLVAFCRCALPLLFAALLWVAPARPAAAADVAGLGQRFWREAAQIDVEAAYRMLSADHPGAATQVDDPEFKHTLAAAHALAAKRAAQVDSFDGYAATLIAFGNSFRDAHVRARPILRRSMADWPGLLIGLRGEAWTVVDALPGEGDSLLGAILVGCDGRGAEDLAHERLGGFRVDWSSRAQRADSAAWLLVDDHNPFLARPKTCTFEAAGKRREVALAWTPIKLPELLARIEAHKPYGASGFGVRKAGDGYWIALESMLDGAPAVLQQVEAMADALRQAPFVVLDLRGNGGGSSFFGERIAGVLSGQARVEAAMSAASGCGQDVYRATPANLAIFREYRARWGQARGAEWTTAVDRLIAAMENARATGQTFSGPVACTPPAAAPLPPPTAPVRLYLLTDGACFSSCLVVTDLWRRLGAVQLGQETDANTHYLDVRDQPMPSGMTTFSTLMGVTPGTPLRLGPFTPEHVYPGDIGDTAAVERWALETIAQ